LQSSFGFANARILPYKMETFSKMTKNIGAVTTIKKKQNILLFAFAIFAMLQSGVYADLIMPG